MKAIISRIGIRKAIERQKERQGISAVIVGVLEGPWDNPIQLHAIRLSDLSIGMDGTIREVPHAMTDDGLWVDLMWCD